MVNRISDDRDYLFNFPNMAGTDSLNVYLPASSGDIIEKRSGILIPVVNAILYIKTGMR
jgi:hypothetical protein